MLLMIGCGSGQSKPQPVAQSAPTTAPQPPSAEMCSMMNVAGAQIATSDTSDGIAIEFTTTGDIAELRARVRQMAAMHDRMATHDSGTATSAPGTAGDTDTGTQKKMQGKMQMVPSHASVEDIAGGARMVLTPVDPSQLAELREQVRSHAEMMRTGKCPMMEMNEQRLSPPDDHSQHHPAGS